MVVTPNKKPTIMGTPEYNIQSVFSRSGVAYDPWGATILAGQDRHQMLVPGQTVTNLLTGNQSDGGDTLNPELLTLNQRTGTDTLGDTTGYTPSNVTYVTLSSSTEQAHTGTRSLKVVTSVGAATRGVYIDRTTVNAGTAYINGVWVYLSGTDQVQCDLIWYDVSNVEVSTVAGTTTTTAGQWVYLEASGTAPANTTNCRLRIGHSGGSTQDFYVDDCRLATNVTTGLTAVGGTISVTGEKAYQGYRCIKANYAGTNQGLYIATSTINDSVKTFTAKILVPNGIVIDVKLGSGGTDTITGTGNWQSINVTRTPNNNFVYIYTHNNDTGTFYLDSCMVETGSVAHDWAYGGSSYSTGYHIEQGLLVEEATTNLLTANQSTGTDTLGTTTGFAQYDGTESLSSTTDHYFSGSRSLKVVTPGNKVGEGFYVSVATTASQSYNFSGWVKMPLGSPFWVIAQAVSYYTGTGNWQYVSATGVASGASTTFFIGTRSTPQSITFYADQLQVENKAYPTSWTLGGTTRNAETMTIPSSVLNIDTSGYSNLCTASVSNGSSKLDFSDSNLLSQNTGVEGAEGGTTISYAFESNGDHQIRTATKTTVVPGVTYTISITSRETMPSGTVPIGIYCLDGSTFRRVKWSAVPVSSTFRQTDYVYTCEADVNAIQLVIQRNTGLIGEVIEFDKAQVTATSSVKPWILGGTQSNTGQGTIECEIMISPTMVGTTASLDIFGASSTSGTNKDAIYIQRYNGHWYGETGDNTGNASIYTDYAQANTALTVYSWVKIGMTWDVNNIKFYVNGVLVATSASNPKLPSARSLFNIGAGGGGIIPANILTRSFVVSKTKRSDAEITSRAQNSSPSKDRQTTARGELKGDITFKGYTRV